MFDEPRHHVATMIALLLLLPVSPVRGDESCPPSPGRDDPGRLVEIQICAADARRCGAGGKPAYKAGRTASPEVQSLAIPDIPEGYIITGAELFTSTYDLGTRGFGHFSFASHGDVNDYCARHGRLDMSAEWTGEDPSDKMTIEACVRFEKWSGPAPIGTCPAP
jgi:hypothetical protein